MSEIENDINTIKEFFERDGQVLAKGEMIAFWKSLSPAEKDYYKTADLS